MCILQTIGLKSLHCDSSVVLLDLVLYMFVCYLDLVLYVCYLDLVLYVCYLDWFCMFVIQTWFCMFVGEEATEIEVMLRIRTNRKLMKIFPKLMPLNQADNAGLINIGMSHQLALSTSLPCSIR